MKTKDLKLDQKGYQRLLKELTETEKELHILRFGARNDVIKTARWYDDPDVMTNHLQEQVLLKKINMIKEQLKLAKIIEKQSNNESVDVDDIIKLDIFNDNQKEEEMLVKLVGGIGNFNVNPLEVSINSPLGDAIYQKIIGEKVNYQVGTNKFFAIIKEKVL